MKGWSSYGKYFWNLLEKIVMEMVFKVCEKSL